MKSFEFENEMIFLGNQILKILKKLLLLLKTQTNKMLLLWEEKLGKVFLKNSDHFLEEKILLFLHKFKIQRYMNDLLVLKMR